MTQTPRLRRLLDLKGVEALERQAVMKPLAMPGEGPPAWPEIDACSREHFGLTAEEARSVPRPEGWDGVEDRPIAQQVAAFEAAGWDVTDARRRPLRVLGRFNQQLWLALRGVAGALPFEAEAASGHETPGGWGANLAAEAERFRRR